MPWAVSGYSTAIDFGALEENSLGLDQPELRAVLRPQRPTRPREHPLLLMALHRHLHKRQHPASHRPTQIPHPHHQLRSLPRRLPNRHAAHPLPIRRRRLSAPPEKPKRQNFTKSKATPMQENPFTNWHTNPKQHGRTLESVKLYRAGQV